MDKNKRAQLLRHGVQLAAFLAAPSLFVTVFSAAGALVAALASGSFTLAGMAGPLTVLAAALVTTALWGRVFCGWLCAFGALGDLLGWVGRRLRLPQLPRSAKLDRALRWVKYAVLAFIAAAVWALALPVEADWSPWSAFGMLTSWNPAVMRAALTTVGFALLLVVVLASLFVERFFCRYLCPLGALLAPVSKLRQFRVERRAEGCVGCAACSRACPMNVAVHAGDAAASGECIGCLRCTGACHADCVDAKPSPALAGETVAAALAALVLLGGGAATTGATAAAAADEPASVELGQHMERGGKHAHGWEELPMERGEDGRGFRHRRFAEGLTPDGADGALPQRRFGEQSTDNDAAAEPSAPAAGATALTDGVYTGTGTGYRGDTTVQVTVKGGAITDVEVLSYRDDRNFFERAKGVIDSILSRQTVEVDTVSGATWSSRGILSAVADALGIEYEAAQSAMRGVRGTV